MSGPKIIPFGRGKAESAAADTHLAEARCQEARPAFRDIFFVKIRILTSLNRFPLYYDRFMA